MTNKKTHDCRLPTPDCRLPTKDLPGNLIVQILPLRFAQRQDDKQKNARLPTADCRLPTPDSRLPTADSRLPTTDCRLTPHASRFTPHASRLTSPYSVLKLFTGLASAALIACTLIVDNAITSEITAASTNTHASILI